jgi:DNA-directed RNA polymerase II subunit RPB2
MEFFRDDEHIIAELITEDKIVKHKLEFKNIRAELPKLANNIDPMFPADSRHLELTYKIIVYADTTQIKETILINDNSENKVKTIKVGNTERNKPIMIIPTMVKSKYCNLNAYPEEMKDECKYDPGGYFIVNGSEKIVIPQDEMIKNKPLVFIKKNSNIEYYVAQINSKSSINRVMQTISIKMKKDNIMTIRMPILQELNVIVLFKALGIVSDFDIINLCCYDINDKFMIEVLRTTIDNCIDTENNVVIQTQEQALDYLISKMKVIKRYTESNKMTKYEQKKLHLLQLLKISLFPHIETGENIMKKKVYFLGYMINKLLKVQLGREEIDNRDSYCNKRVSNIRELFEEIMIQQYKTIMADCNKQFINRMGDDLDSDEPYNIMHQFKATSFEQGFKASLMMGNWPRKKGVSQMLQRGSYMYFTSYLSRVDSQSGSQASSKLTKPRQVDPSSIPFLCVVQSPEHSKIGLIKHLTMISSLTIGHKDNTNIVREFILNHKDVKNILDVPIRKYNSMYKVFLNGEWLGLIENNYNLGDKYTDNPVINFYSEAKANKVSGIFNCQMTGIVFDYRYNEIRFNTDSGRLFRPVIRVNGDNEMMVTKKMIDNINLNKRNGKVSSWEEFYTQKPYPIEFIDSEEQPFLMIAEDIKQLRRERKKIIDSEKFKFNDDESKVINRYDDKFFNRFDHIEIHPSVLLGEIATNIPLCNKNMGPRNIFQYAQGRQGMCIYATNYRARTDISYVLYNPEVPVVNSRTSKYTYADVLPPGSNAVVAIACYTGYNQEDSLIVNKTACERGLFRAMLLRRAKSSITKNQDTSGDDKFMKPPPDKTIGIKNGQYDKLNEKGFIPEETKIVNGDIIFGKVTPITDMGDSDIAYKDSSEQYKSHADGVVDRVYTGIKNQDGYETRKALIRSERIPHIGDKMTSRHGQKGTIGILLDNVDMPFTKHGMRPDIIINPNAIPSRMTIAQLWECLMGKSGALNSMNMDGTPFEDYDLEEIKKMLLEKGYQYEGLEYLYNGMTGKKMKHMIFIGPTWYQRNKHMTFDKIHSRARGRVTTLTRNAPEGRSRDGGLRLGEMERDAIIAHGMAVFLKERIMECADAYSTHVCGICGLFAVREESRNNKPVPSPEDSYYCPLCKNYNDIHVVSIPYAFKLMIQELMAMNIAPRLRVQKHLSV